jgi:selenoprotein W-related protein
MTSGHKVEISYCRLCNWLLRASWMAQEMLSTFSEELSAVTLIPDSTGGVFDVRLNGELLWSRKQEGRFPDISELKRLLRDRVAPERSLGHVDAQRHS